MKLRHLAPAALLLCASAQAAQLVVYNFTTASNTDSIGASAVFTNVTAGLFTDHVDVGSTSAGISSSNANYFARANLLPATEADAVANGDYVDFTLSAAPGYALNLSTLTFAFGTSSTSTASYTTNAALRTSLDSNFGTTVGTPASITTQTSGNTFPLTPSFDLSGAQYQSIGAITFRIYLYDNSDLVSPITRIDSLIVNGTVVAAPVPEPASFASLAGAAGLLAGLARRRRRS